MAKYSSAVADPKYGSAISANPYRGYNYQQGWFDKLGNWLGFRTNEDKFREQMDIAAREYDAQLENQHREEDYNDAASQAERLRQAGINPDLNGVDAGSAAEFNEPQMSPEVPGDSGGMQLIQGIGDILGNVFTLGSSALGFAQNIRSLKAMKLANTSSEMNLMSQLFNTGRDLLGNLAGRGDINDGGNSVSAFNIVRSLPISRKLQNAVVDAMNSGSSSLRSLNDLYGYENGITQSKVNIADLKSRAGYSENISDMVGFYKPLSNFAYKLQSLQMEMNYQEYKNRKAYAERARDNSVPEAKADVEYGKLTDEYRNVQSRLTNSAPEIEGATDATEAKARATVASEAANEARFKTEINSAYRDFIHELKKNADKGDVFSQVGLLFAPVLLNSLTDGSALLKFLPTPAKNVNIHHLSGK